MSQKKTQRRQAALRKKKALRRRKTRARRPWEAVPRAKGSEARPRSGAAHSTEVEASDPSLQRWARLLTKADKDPDCVLDDPRCLKPQFVARFFDLCDGKALEAPWAAPDYAEVALKLAEKLDDPHQIHLAKGIQVHAYIGNSRWREATELLLQYREQALACCDECASDWLRRQGDLLVETQDPALSRTYLERAAEALGTDLDDETRGRILFVRAIAHHFLGDVDQALDDAGAALRLLSLSTPYGYFVDNLALIICYLRRTVERRHFEVAHAHVIGFRERLKGHKIGVELRDRLRWALAPIEAKLGHPRRARAALGRTYAHHVQRSPHHYALAIALDEALVYCLHLPEHHVGSIQRILKQCKLDLKLEPELRKRLLAAANVLGQQPYRVREILVEFRQSFKAPVPGLLCDPRPLAADGARASD